MILTEAHNTKKNGKKQELCNIGKSGMRIKHKSNGIPHLFVMVNESWQQKIVACQPICSMPLRPTFYSSLFSAAKWFDAFTFRF